jgi:hypothetical protein
VHQDIAECGTGAHASGDDLFDVLRKLIQHVLKCSDSMVASILRSRTIRRKTVDAAGLLEMDDNAGGCLDLEDREDILHLRCTRV